MNLLEEIFELNENIPRDLVKAYLQIGDHSDRSREYERPNPMKSHKDIKRAQDDRRTIKIDYGKSSYEELTPEEADAYIANDKSKIANLRLLLDGQLVEADLNENGNIYAYTRNPNRRIDKTIRTKRGEEKTISAKNIGYITNPYILFRVVDKIYKTDEYDHFISPEDREEREDKKESEYTEIGSFDKSPYQDNYTNFVPDDHRPYDNFMSHSRVATGDIDTGDHYGARFSYFFSHNDLSSNSLENKLLSYRDALEAVKDNYRQIDTIRKSIAHLKNHHAGWTEEEYNNELARRQEHYKNYKDDYDKSLLSLKKIKQNIFIDINSKEKEVKDKLEKSFKIIQDASHDLENTRQSINNKIATRTLSYSSMDNYYRSCRNTLQKTESDLSSLANYLQQLPEPDSKLSDNDLEDLVNKLEEINDELDDRILTMIKNENIALKYWDKHSLKKKDELDKAEAEIHPKDAERRRIGREKQNIVIDPDIENLLDFEDTDDNDDNNDF